MKFKKRLFILTLAALFLFTSCTNTSDSADVNASFENFTFTLFQQDVAATTIGLHYSLENPEDYGIHEFPITYGTYHTDTTETLAVLENCQAALENFPYNLLSQENQLTYDVLSSYLETAKTGTSFILYEEPLSPVTGIHAQLPVLLAEYSFSSVEDVDTYLKLLETTPEYFDSLISFEQEKSEAGLFMASYTVDAVLEQCNAFLAMGEENYLLSTFADRLEPLQALSEKDKTDYINTNKAILESCVYPAYEKLASALTELKDTGNNTQGLCYFPGGKDYYTYLAAKETCSSRSVEELADLIEKQMTNDILAMQKVFSQNPDLSETTSASSDISLDASAEEILQDLETQIASTFPDSQDVNVEIKYVPDALEPYLSPAFYLIPAVDNSLDNVIYINQTYTFEDIHLFTTLAHEGYPGHLYQTTYYASQNPDPIRTLFNFKGYTEGWATYAEMCSYYLSPLEKPYATLLQKNSSLILGLYAFADIGIHYYGWNLERTEQFFATYGIEDAQTIQEIYGLIIGDPANYLSYYIGYVEILELKQEMIDMEKENFSQKEFHQKFLNVGPAPFDIVEKVLIGIN